MPLQELIKTLVCTPTQKCCEKMCAKNKAKTERLNDGAEQHQSKMLALLNKIIPSTSSLRLKKSREVRRATGWDPRAKQMIYDDDEDDDDDDDDDDNAEDDDPVKKKWKGKKSVVFPISIASTVTEFGQRHYDYPIESEWENKDAAIYSSVTVSDTRASYYWIQSNLQYVVILPVDRTQRASSQRITSSYDGVAGGSGILPATLAGALATAIDQEEPQKRYSSKEGTPRRVSWGKESPRKGSSKDYPEEESPRKGPSKDYPEEESPRKGYSNKSKEESPRKGSSKDYPEEESLIKGSSKESPEEGSPRKGSSKDYPEEKSPRKGSSKESSKEESPRKGSSKESHKEEFSRKGSSKEEPSKKESLEEDTPEEESHRQGFSKEESSRKGSSKESPKEVSPRKGSSKEEPSKKEFLEADTPEEESQRKESQKEQPRKESQKDEHQRKISQKEEALKGGPIKGNQPSKTGSESSLSSLSSDEEFIGRVKRPTAKADSASESSSDSF